MILNVRATVSCRKGWVVGPNIFWVPAAISSRKDAIKRATSIDPSIPVAFKDGSARNNFLGIGVYWE